MAEKFFTNKEFLFVGFLILQAWHIIVITCCPSISNPRGNMTEDFDLEVGSPLRIQCSLFYTEIKLKNATFNVSSEDLYIKFGGTILDNVAILDEYTVEYFVQNATVNDTGFYACYISIENVITKPFVCSTYVAVGYKPLHVENFTCISLEYRNLTCSWKSPFNPVKTQYVLYDYFGYETRKRKCPEILNASSCQWTLDTSPPYMRSKSQLSFMIIGNNSLGKSKQYANVEHFKIVRPSAPLTAKFMNVTATTMTLHWSSPRDMEYGEFRPGLTYSIQYRPMYTYPTPYKEIRLYFLTGGFAEITDLIPHTEYEFKIRCRSNVSDSDLMWSPALITSMGTLPDVPYWTPEIANSSFDIETILGNRTISLYWKAIPAVYENAGNFQYVIQFHVHHVPSRIVRESEVVVVGNRTTYSFNDLDINSAYIFKIFARNSIGNSANTSQIIVDKADKLLEGPKDITVISDKGNYNISWKAPGDQVKYYTLFWCESLEPRPVRCQGALEWLHLSQTHYQLKLSDKSTNYQFAVSANTEVQTSGMFWASCIVSNSGVLYKIKSIELTPKHSTSLKVQWFLDCEAQKSVVQLYAIHYCETGRVCSGNINRTTCTNEKVVYIRDRRLNEYYLVSLKPYTCYRAFMRVRTSSGWSEDSNMAYESTLSSAPSDSPGDVKVLKIDGTRIRISFVPPRIPNGLITRYIVTYNKTSDGTSHHFEIRVQEMEMVSLLHVVDLQKSVFYYSNYSIEVEACVEKACSQPSAPVYAFTDISRPGIMLSPRVEILEASMNISWNPPFLANGPLDLYQVLKESNNGSVRQIYNVTGANFFIIAHDCSSKEDDKTVYHFKVRAVNLKDDMPLYGDFSKPTKTILCAPKTSYALIIGSTAGAVIGFVLFVLLMYFIISWMKKEVAMIKGINVQLPKGLDSPIDNPLNSYDKFKSGLQKSHDSGIPYDRTYERLCSFASEGDTKDVGNGCILTEEPSERSKRHNSGRNNSGESDASGKCHDSISSSNTTKTHLSIDSGAEIDSPPSPDGFFSDTSSSNTTPRSYKPDLAIVKESNGSVSKDSGLEKEGTGPNLVSQSMEIPSKFSWYVRKKNYPFSIEKSAGQMPAYSKFAVLTSNTPSYIPYGEQNLSLLEKSSLSNSEPSVSDFDTCSEPVIHSGIPPYSKFGLARSAGNGLNISNPPFTLNTNVGYSKFGTTYRALPQMNNSRENNLPVLPSGTKGCLKFAPQGHQTLTALAFHHSPFYLQNIRPTNLCCNGLTKKSNEKGPLKEDTSNAYSKFGVNAVCSANGKMPSNNGYVRYNDVVKYDAYSKVGMAPKPDNEASRSSYVTFQDAKSMNVGDSPKAAAKCPSSSPDLTEKNDFNYEVDKDEPVASGCNSLLYEISADLGIDLEGSISPNIQVNQSMGIATDDNHSVCPSPPYSVLSNISAENPSENLKDDIPSEENKPADCIVQNTEHNIANNSELCNDISQMSNNEMDEREHDHNRVVTECSANNLPVCQSAVKGNAEQIHSACNSNCNDLDLHVTDNSVDDDFSFYGQTNTEQNERLHSQRASRGYVPFSELTKEPGVPAHVTRPTLAHLPVQNV